ncbi:MAG TPA: PorV/PorQ family protein [Candidatus Latescibacteria bacterium]|nr:PorV/PorQ family protein [Candidatus Latescibacterota bacterium]
MTHARSFVAALVAAFVASSSAFAQIPALTFNQTKLGQAGMKFLEIGQSARAEGMGGAVTGLEMGAASMFYNPAGLANTGGKCTDVYLGHTEWAADVALNAVAVARNTPYGVFGVSAMAVDYGTVKGYQMTVSGAVTGLGNLDLSSMAIGVGAARKVTDKFQIGLAGRYAVEDLGLVNSSGSKTSVFVFDAGTLYRTGVGSSVLSMSIRNFSRQARHQDEGYDLPLIFRIGLAADLLNMTDMPSDNMSSLVVSADALHPRDRAEELVIGAEYGLMQKVFLRGAFRTGRDYANFVPKVSTTPPMTTSLVSLGAGIRHTIGPTAVGVNYAWSNAGSLLGSVHRFDVQVGF